MKKIILFCFVLIISCQNDKNTFPGHIIIKHDVEKIEAIPLEGKDALFDYKIVQLETDPKSLLAEIHQLEIADNYIYIFDKKGESVKKFTIDGKYIRDIGAKGEGSEEYIAVNAFYVNKEKKRINLFDPMKKAILRYDFDGNFIEIIKTNNPDFGFIMKASAIQNDEVFCYSSINWYENYQLFILDENDYSVKKVIRYHPSKPKQWNSFSFAGNPFSNRGDKVVFVSLYSDFIYTYKEGNISESILITDNKKTLSNEEIDKKLREEFNKDMMALMLDVCKSDYYTVGLREIVETNSYVLCNYYDYDGNMTSRTILWDKEQKHCYRLSPTRSPNFHDVSYSFDDTFVRIWKEYDIDGFKEDIEKGINKASQFPESIMDLIRDYSGANENPMLIFYTPKKHGLKNENE